MRLLADEPQLRSVDAALVTGVICTGGSVIANQLTGWGCPLHAFTGWWCPFCGGTRSVEALAHWHIDAALRDNSLVVLVLVFVVLRFALRVGGGHAALRRLDGCIERVHIRVWTIALVTWLVIRNLPGLAFLGPPVGR